MFKKDHILHGLIPGMICPLIAGFAYYLSMFSKTNLSQLYRVTVEYHVFGPILAIGGVVNLGLFFIFIKFNRLKAANGVIIATLAYIVITMYYKFAA